MKSLSLRNIIPHCHLVLLFILFGACLGGQDAVGYKGERIAITNWLSLGPLFPDVNQEAISEEILSRYGLVQSEVLKWKTFDDLYKSSKPAPLPIGQFVRLLYKECINFHIEYNLPKGGGNSAPTFYVATRIKCDSPQQAHLLLASDGILKVWVNGALLGTLTKPRAYDFEPFSGSLPISLGSGYNDLIIKIVQVPTSCGLVANIVPTESQLVDYVFQENGSFLRNLIVAVDMPLRFEMRGGPATFRYELKISDLSQKAVSQCIVTQDQDSISTKGLLPGVYEISFIHNHKQFNEKILIGDVRKLTKELSDLVASKKTDEKSHLNIDGLRTRLALLTEEAAIKVKSREWQRKFIYTVAEIGTAFDSLDKTEDPWKGKVGLHLRAFRSKIDGQVRHYRIFVPKDYDPNKKLALALLMPTSLSAARPFIESPFVSHHMEAEYIGRLAEAYGIGILWPGYPTVPFGNPCEFVHVQEVLGEVSSDYAVDRGRLFLMGTCRAGMTATMLAEKFPSDFAGIGILNPIMSRSYNNSRGDPNYRKFSAYGIYLANLAPLRHLDVIKDIPLLITMDEGDPNHGTVEDAEEFAENAKLAGMQLCYSRIPFSLAHIRAWSEILAFFSRIKPKIKEGFSTGEEMSEPSRVGPIANVLSRGFVVVEGTVGTQSARKGIKRLADDLVKKWAKDYFGECIRMYDYEVTSDVRKTKTLILIGDQSSNQEWVKVADANPFRLFRDKIIVGNSVYNGSGMSIQAVVQSPYNSRRGILFITSQDLEGASYLDWNPSIDGWCNYCIWKNKPQKLPDAIVAAELYGASKSDIGTPVVNGRQVSIYQKLNE